MVRRFKQSGIVAYWSRDDCPGCGESLFDTRHIEAHACHVGHARPSWTLYFCPLCQSWFKVYWPGRVATSARLERILAGEEARGW